MCGADNRACEASAVYVDPLTGSDATTTGDVAAPFETISAAVAAACVGFIECLPVRLMPGVYEGPPHRVTVANKVRVRLLHVPREYVVVVCALR